MTGTPHDPELLSAGLDGALTPDEAERVDAWLATSADARAERDGLAAVKAALARLPDVEPPAGFYERMLEAGSPRHDAEVVPLRRRTVLAAAGAVVAAAAVCVLVAGSGATVTPPVDDVEAALAAPDDRIALVRQGSGELALLQQDASDVHWDDLPHGDRGERDGADTWVDLTSDPGVARVVVAHDGRVYTLVSEDLPAEALVEVGLDLPGDDSVVGRFRRACEELVEAFSGG
jgi:hypothetical protein